MTKEQVIELVGANSVNENGGDYLRLAAVPRQHPAFQETILKFSPLQGLLKIAAFTPTIIANSFGDQLREPFKSIRAALLSAYGSPTSDFDFVHAGSIWTDDHDWMQGLALAERILSSYWQFGAPRNGITTIALTCTAVSHQEGMLTLSYEFDGWDQYVAEQEKQTNAVF
jgi:hypothetical protein